jgi:hypothetical protein
MGVGLPRVMLRRRRRSTILGLSPQACAISAALTAGMLAFLWLLGEGLKASKPLPTTRGTLRGQYERRVNTMADELTGDDAHVTRISQGVLRPSATEVSARPNTSGEEDDEDPSEEQLVVITVRPLNYVCNSEVEAWLATETPNPRGLLKPNV